MTTMKKGAVLFGVLGPEPKVSCVRQVLSHTPNHISFEHATDGATHSSENKVLESYLFLSNDVLAKRDCKIAVIYGRTI